jgi:hypothetical protein
MRVNRVCVFGVRELSGVGGLGLFACWADWNASTSYPPPDGSTRVSNVRETIPTARPQAMMTTMTVRIDVTVSTASLRDTFISGGTRRNLEWVRPHLRPASDVTEDDLLLLADAQTSAGLLVVGELPGYPVVGHTVVGRGIEVRRRDSPAET